MIAVKVFLWVISISCLAAHSVQHPTTSSNINSEFELTLSEFVNQLVSNGKEILNLLNQFQQMLSKKQYQMNNFVLTISEHNSNGILIRFATEGNVFEDGLEEDLKRIFHVNTTEYDTGSPRKRSARKFFRERIIPAILKIISHIHKTKTSNDEVQPTTNEPSTIKPPTMEPTASDKTTTSAEITTSEVTTSSEVATSSEETLS